MDFHEKRNCCRTHNDFVIQRTPLLCNISGLLLFKCSSPWAEPFFSLSGSFFRLHLYFLWPLKLTCLFLIFVLDFNSIISVWFFSVISISVLVFPTLVKHLHIFLQFFIYTSSLFINYASNSWSLHLVIQYRGFLRKERIVAIDCFSPLYTGHCFFANLIVFFIANWTFIEMYYGYSTN